MIVYTGVMGRERKNRDVVPEFAARLKAARLAAGLTQAALAEEAGTSQASVARLEDCSRAPSLKMAHRLLKALGIYLHDLLPYNAGPKRDDILTVLAALPRTSRKPTPP